jgi:G:T-mismatch repair DNA endonuclease (very short patch repair protein)
MDAFGISAQSAIVSRRQILNFGGIKLRQCKTGPKVTKELRKAGWSVCRIWECQLKKPTRSLTRIQKLLAKNEI